MYLSDEKALDYIAIILLMALPVLGIAWGTWGWFWELLILFFVFWVGKSKQIMFTALILAFGYALSTVFFGTSVLTQIGFVPWAALLSIFGWRKSWSQRETFFWSILLAGILGAIPTLKIVIQGLEPESIKLMIESLLDFYKSSGMLTIVQEQGIAEMQFKTVLEQLLPFYILIIPSITALFNIIIFGLTANYVQHWFLARDNFHVPFSHWRLPWYAVWGAILALGSYLIGDQFTLPGLRGLGINLMVVYVAFALVIGTSVYTYFLKSPRIPRFLKWGLIFINIFYFVFTFISVVFFGLFDLVFNFRRLPEKPEGGI